MGMLALEGDLLRDAGPGGDDPIGIVVARQVHVGRLRPTKPPGCLGRGLEDGLQVERRPADDPQDLGHSGQPNEVVPLEGRDPIVDVRHRSQRVPTTANAGTGRIMPLRSSSPTDSALTVSSTAACSAG